MYTKSTMQDRAKTSFFPSPSVGISASFLSYGCLVFLLNSMLEYTLPWSYYPSYLLRVYCTCFLPGDSNFPEGWDLSLVYLFLPIVPCIVLFISQCSRNGIHLRALLSPVSRAPCFSNLPDTGAVPGRLGSGSGL